MALKFKCEKCGGEIAVKYLKPGEKAQCRHCGAYVTVPQNGAEADEEPDLKKMRRYRGAGKPRDPFEGYRCPACGGTNLNGVSFWFGGGSGSKIRRVFKCGDCGARFSVMHPRAARFWFWYALGDFVVCGLIAIYIYRLIKFICSILW